jgi:Fe-S cluster assembly iron-binding protein IscA
MARTAAAQLQEEDSRIQGGSMLIVTPEAAAKLREAIRAQTADPDVCIRLVRSPLGAGRFGMTLDTAREGDQVVQSQGMKVLIISPELAPLVSGKLLDCQEALDSLRFTLSKLSDIGSA